MAVYMFEQTVKCIGSDVGDIKFYKENQVLEKTLAPIRYVFTRTIEPKEIREYEKAGIGAEQIVGMYQYFTDNYNLECSVRTEDKLDELKRNLQYTYANAYSKYDVILNTIREYGKNKLILLMLGSTAKVLACDLAFEDYWAVDIGHIDSEYEWYRKGATGRILFRNKHTADANSDDNEHIELQEDDAYAKVVVAMLTDEQ